MGKDPIRWGGAQENFYVYAGNDPVDSRDPLGLYGTDDCSYYSERCASTGDMYYCSIADNACSRFPKGDITENPEQDQGYFVDWAQCVRECLQDCDRGLQQEQEENPVSCVPFGAPDSPIHLVGCHVGCWGACALGSGNPF